ncbi:hypothetical protein L208DRAFT_1315808 [Tricholoma matsutake]|nr:hypothetical protein L208DRAFT_1315808 [Tricholoma matsutake 945]
MFLVLTNFLYNFDVYGLHGHRLYHSPFCPSSFSLLTFSHSLGELIIPSQNLFNSSKHVSRDTLPIQFSCLSNGMEHATFHIPWTKTTAELGADISITAHDHPTCPLLALKHHLLANVLLPWSAPLFTFETADGGWAPMTRSWFMDHCNVVWVAAGLPQMLGHTFQIGSTTELLLEGIDPSVVASQKHWMSHAFLEYWYHIESILPLVISNATNSHCAHSVEASMIFMLPIITF